MSPESAAEKMRRWTLAEESARLNEHFMVLQSLTEEEFRSQNWQVDVSFDDRNGTICVYVRIPSNSGPTGGSTFPCDAPFTSEKELQAAISRQEHDPSANFLFVEILRAVYAAAFGDEEPHEEWEATVERRRQILERERIVAEAARNGSPSLAEGAL